MSYDVINLPPQQLPFNRKTVAWRKKHLDWADNKSFSNYSLVRNSVKHKKINYDLINGILHMEDLLQVLNPDSIQASFIPEKILHYPIMNSKLNVLRGEESKRVFDYKVIVTNPNSISEIENTKKKLILQRLLEMVLNTALSEEEFNAELEKLNKYFTYEWLDFREVRGNALINHYSKELDFPFIFNQGFMDALTVSEEMYQCDIIGGEPVLKKLNPNTVRVFRSGHSNRIEDADMIVIETYQSPGQIIDEFYDSLTDKDRKYIESIPFADSDAEVDSMGNIDERFGFVRKDLIDDNFSSDEFYWNPVNGTDSIDSSLLPYDSEGNIKVLRVYWKSRRKIKKVKSYDPTTGEEVYNLYPETYVINKDLGEEELIFYINEAWEGTKIGKDIYVNMRPRLIQYNRISNPSRCHFGIIGSIYNLNDSKPFSLVDMMKPYNYYYDVIHDRLNKLMAHNWGKIIQLDLAKVPEGWDIDKWMYYAKVNNIAVVDSFKEGHYGAATGKLAAALNNASSGVIDAEVGNIILNNINLLEFIKMEMSEVAGITRLREGQISNRETVGGVERATLLSSHITEWLFLVHDSVKKRVIECMLETAKAALRGRNLKFSYILSDYSRLIIEIDGDEFAESDYGLVVSNDNGVLELSLKLDMLAQAALLNQALSFSTIMKLYNSTSLAEKQRFVEEDERQLLERQAQALQLEMQVRQEEINAKMLLEQAKMELENTMNERDNETKILIATMQLNNTEDDGIKEPEYSLEAKDKLLELIREFDAKIKLDRDKLAFEKDKAKTDARLKEKQINKKPNTSKS